MIVTYCKLCEVRAFLEEYHYSHSVNGCKVAACYKLLDKERIVGAILFGALSTTAWKKYGDKESDVIELRRLVCLDECPKNTETWFIARTLKLLRKELPDCKTVVSYADPTYGHCGYIYQAGNWNYEGTTSPDTVFLAPNKKLYHSRALRTKYQGRYKPFVLQLRSWQSDGELIPIKIMGKHIYTYSLQGKHKAVRTSYPKKGVLDE